MKKRRSWAAVAVAVLALVGPACVIDNDDEDTGLVEMNAEVEAFDDYFSSTTVILEPDTEATVTLVNNGSNLHSFTVPDLDVEIEAEGGESTTLTFSTDGLAGSYEFLCKYHPEEMNGNITIEADGVDVDVDVDDDDDDVEVTPIPTDD